MTFSPSKPDDAGGDGRDDDEPGDALVRRPEAAAAQRRPERGDEPQDVVPEVRGDRDERPEVERDVERLVEAVVLLEVRPVAEPRHEDEVAG